jgi:moderate conductance mechanosensitive channel
VNPIADETTEATDTAWYNSLLGTPLNVAIILGIAIVAHFLSHHLINQAVKRWIASGRNRAASMNDTPEETVEIQAMLMSQRREQRAQAVGQLLLNFFVLLIWGLATLLLLTELGINIAPIIASAGIAGVALGFGAQTLVKDYLSGFFMIIEDQYGVGDLVDVGPVIGTVEEVTLRITRIRDMSGVVWYVRNGEILRVANQSQGWTMASAVIPVAYSADLHKIRTIVRQVADDMVNDPETRTRMIGRPDFAGVDSVSGEAIYVRIVAKAKASQQVPLTRELRERLKIAFDANDVVVAALARPVTFGPDGNPLPPGTQPPAPPAR